jgi:hypothetical protein
LGKLYSRKQVGKAVKKTVRREALGQTVLVFASREGSKEDSQKRGSWANCTRGSKSGRQERRQSEQRLLGKLYSCLQVGKAVKKTVRRWSFGQTVLVEAVESTRAKAVKKTVRTEALGQTVLEEASREDSKEDSQKMSFWANCTRGSKSERQ